MESVELQVQRIHLVELPRRKSDMFMDVIQNLVIHIILLQLHLVRVYRKRDALERQ